MTQKPAEVTRIKWWRKPIWFGLIVGLTDFFAHHFSGGNFVSGFGDAFLKSLITMLVVSLWNDVTRLDVAVDAASKRLRLLSKRVRRFDDLIEHDERIICAREEQKREGAIAVVAIEEVRPKPPKNAPQPRCGKGTWRKSISILRFDRIQDLLFSAEYLEHFFSLRSICESPNRLLIVNDRPRSREAVYSFLRISEKTGINTYLYQKSEFYEMIKIVGRKMAADDAAIISEVLQGQPELNLMMDDPKLLARWNGATKDQSEYLLRYVNSKEEIIDVIPGDSSIEGKKVSYDRVRLIGSILDVAINQARYGDAAFEGLLGQRRRPKNYWSEERLESLLK